MTDEEFRKLCNVFGFAPSRALRELIDCVRAQEIEACAKVCDHMASRCNDMRTAALEMASENIRARKEKQ